MADTAAFLVDRVLPRVPVRQWVLTFPRPIRFVLARDSKLLSKANRIYVEEIFRDYRRRLEVRGGGKGECGAVTGVQRFGGALNLNVHLHTPVLDGAYVTDPKTGAIGFRRAPTPTREDLERVLGRTRKRVLAFLSRKGHVWEEGEEGEEEEPTSLDLAQAASIRHWVGVAGGPGRPVPVLGKRDEGWVAPPEKPFAVRTKDGFSLEAGVRIRAGDREGLEQLCRYILRPPFAEERLQELPDGRILYKFRRPWPDGSSHLVLEPVEFVACHAEAPSSERCEGGKSWPRWCRPPDRT